jgi:hypothetical protein
MKKWEGADLFDAFLFDSLPNIVQPALELVYFRDVSPYYLIQEFVIRRDVGVQSIVTLLQLDRSFEQLTRERTRVQ